MTRLKCDVTSCASNASGGCMRNGITVTGTCAGSSCETCCSSFTLSHGGSMNNACGVSPEAQHHMPISCNAATCMYNSNGCCTATEVHVGGAGASAMSQTCCDTFRTRN
ncbi:MAG: DUF1540 domain-containing protein [Clostridia bacterium]|nr:DUF1540 domain-containing protein [Clostridia bacterium]